MKVLNTMVPLYDILISVAVYAVIQPIVSVLVKRLRAKLWPK